MFASMRRLRELGVVGMNDRNINLIARLNPRTLFPLVDDKLRTKLLAQEYGIPTPGLIGAIRTQHDLRRFREIIGERRERQIRLPIEAHSRSEPSHGYLSF